MSPDLERIFSRLKEMGLEQKAFAQALGTTDKTVSAWKTGRSKSYTKYLPQIAKVIDMPVEYILTGEKKEPAPAPKSEDELVNAIILGRDGKAVKRTYTKEQMEALRKVIDVMPYLDDEEL